jgi:hypothetical protein
LAKLSRADRDAIAEKRLLVNLRAHGIATARTVEQKISDAGPSPQRVDPHILTAVRNRLVGEGKIKSYQVDGTTWYYLPDILQSRLDERFQAQLPVYRNINSGNLPMRVAKHWKSQPTRRFWRARSKKSLAAFLI